MNHSSKASNQARRLFYMAMNFDLRQTGAPNKTITFSAYLVCRHTLMTSCIILNCVHMKVKRRLNLEFIAIFRNALKLLPLTTSAMTSELAILLIAWSE